VATDPPANPTAAPVAAVEKRTTEEVVVLDTTKGKITIRLFDAECPRHAASFKKLAGDGFYNGLPFQRVYSKFFAQTGEKGPCQPDLVLPREPGKKHRRGAIAGVLYHDEKNSLSGSVVCQFYICMSDLPDNDEKFTVFGQVIEGMDAIDKIQSGNPNDGAVPADKADRILTASVITRPAK
jgi:cyclophilin family peptidyl-prolyl cis-trans isomerase